MPLDPLGLARSKAACPSLATPRTAALRSTPALQEPPQPDVMMTRLPSRRLLALALASAIAMPALAQTTEPAAAPVASAPLATAPFTATDIRIDGLQRISTGTVLTYLPIERGDVVTPAKAAEVKKTEARPAAAPAAVAGDAPAFIGIEDFAKLGEKDPFFLELDKCCKAHKGLWNAEAEKMILKHFNVEI